MEAMIQRILRVGKMPRRSRPYAGTMSVVEYAVWRNVQHLKVMEQYRREVAEALNAPIPLLTLIQQQSKVNH